MFTKLRFLSDLPLYDAEQPYEMFCHPTPSSAKVTNCEFTVKDDVCVADVRTSTQDFSLDTVGFQFVKHVSGQLLDPQLFGSVRRPSEQIAVNAYLAEAIRLVETETSAVKVICFDWRVSCDERATPTVRAKPHEVQEKLAFIFALDRC